MATAKKWTDCYDSDVIMARLNAIGYVVDGRQSVKVPQLNYKLGI